jgi:hypothetical protein
LTADLDLTIPATQVTDVAARHEKATIPGAIDALKAGDRLALAIFGLVGIRLENLSRQFWLTQIASGYLKAREAKLPLATGRANTPIIV